MGFFDAVCPDCEQRAFNVWTGICKNCGYDNNVGITSAKQRYEDSKTKKQPKTSENDRDHNDDW